jgi:hypothetical protein
VEPRRPPQAVDVRERQLQRACERIDVAGDAKRVAIRRRVALVDDVRERLERSERLALQAAETQLQLMDDERNGEEDDDVPRVLEREQRDGHAQARLTRARDQPRLEALAAAQHVEHERTDGEIGDGKGQERDEVVQQRDTPRMTARDRERNASGHRCRGIGGDIERGAAQGDGVKEVRGSRAARSDERPPPRAENDHGGELEGARQPEAIRLQRATHALAVGILEETDQDRRSDEESHIRVPHPSSIGRRASPA